MKPKFSAAVIVLATCSALLLAGSAVAGGSAETKVKIEAQSGGFFGYVKSDDVDCANGRKVTLFHQLGNGQDPKSDEKIGTDIAQANGNKYMWSTGNTGSRKGYFYAKAGKISGCKAGYSKSIKAQK